MSGFDALWGDELTEIDVAECLEVETQASQAQVPVSAQPQSIGNTIGDGSDRLGNLSRHPGSILSQIPRMLQSPPVRYDRVQSSASTLSTSYSTVSSSSSCYPTLSQNQRKLKAPIRSLPDMSQTLRDKNQLATKEWLRKELEKHKRQETELEQNRQTLEGEVRLLRERNHSYQQQLIKVREHAEEEFKTKEEKYLDQIKELKKEAESSKIQLAMKSKESEANKERYLELKNVSVLEPEFPQPPVRERSRWTHIGTTPRSSVRVDKQITSLDDDNEDDYYLDQGLTKRARKDTQLGLKSFSCDELIQVMDGPGIPSPTKRLSEVPPVEMKLFEPPLRPSDPTPGPVQSLPSKEPSSEVVKMEVPEFKALDMSLKFPWLKVKGYSLSFHQGHLLDKEVSDKIYMLSDSEIKIIVPPQIDFDPGNVLKMDCSDLQYLEDLEKGETIWGVKLKTMYDKSKPAVEEPSESESKDTEALETVKTILGSQMCGQSPDWTKHNESLTEPHSPGGGHISKANYSMGNEDSMLLRNLEPIHVHLKALTKLANWDSSMDLISSIVQHITLMINELHERVCDPRIPDQLKDQFYNNEFGAGKLFMNGPYQSNDLLTHEKLTERERYVELRRGLAVLSVLCSLNKDTANLVLDPQLLSDVTKNNNSIIPSQNNTTYNRDSFLATSLRNHTQRKIMSKAEESTLKFTDLLKQENSAIGKQLDQLTDRLSGSRLSSDTSSTGASTSTSSGSGQNQLFSVVRTDISNDEIEHLLKSKVERVTARADEEEENLSEGSNPSTVNPDEIMDIEAEGLVEGDFSSSVPRSLDEIDHDSFKAWYETYTQNKLNFTVEEAQSSGTKSQKFSRLLDPQLAEKERRELSVYLKRRKFYKEFYKAVAEKGSTWIPDKSDDCGYTSDVESVKNLFDYENKISTMNSTITSDELASMKPGPFCPVNEDSTGDVEATKSQDESPVDCEWRVNSLQKNEEDPNLTKVEEPAKLKSNKNWSFFEKFKANNIETTNVPSNTDSIAPNADSRTKQTSKPRKHSLAPLKKKAGKDVSPSGSLSDINKEMEMEVEMLYGKTTACKKFDKFRGVHHAINEMAPFTPEFRFPEASCDEDQRSDTLPEHLSTIPIMEDPEFLQTFKQLYTQAETISARLNLKLKPFKKLVTCAFLEQRSSAEEVKSRIEVKRPKKSLTCDGDTGSSSAATSMRNQDESDAIISMLNDEALKYSLNKNIKAFEKKKGNLHLLDGIYEIVSAINYSRLTLVFYPLLSSCVSLMESLFKQSFNNEYFSRESFVLIMKILTEVTCCQPPPDIIEKILGVLLYAVKYPDVVDCLCKKRSNLVSLVTKTEFCFFKGVCMMQLLCYLVGVLSVTSYPGYWTLCLAFTSWLRQLYERYRLYLEPWYPPNQVCNCVRVLHNSLFTSLSKATSFLANHASGGEVDEGVRSTVESIVQDGIRLCEILIDMDSSFVNHLDRFHLYREFLTTIKEMHCDPHFSPLFHLQSHQLKVVECLINANELLASKSKSVDEKQTEMLELEHTKINFNRVFDLNNIFLNCSDKYDLLC